MSKKTQNDVLINGPVNVVRVEGNINGIKKVVYLFGDLHHDLDKQTECSDIHAQNIDTYILDQFNKRKLKHKNKKLDFFFETCPDYLDVNKKDMIYTSKYAWSVDKLFKNQFMSNKNKTLPALDYDDVRLHYVDFRCYLPSILDDVIKTMKNVTSQYTFIKKKLHTCFNTTVVLYEKCTQILKILKNPQKHKISVSVEGTKDMLSSSEHDEKQKFQILENFIYKIKKKYNNHDVGKIIEKSFDDHVVNEYINFIKYIKESQKIFLKLLRHAEKLEYKINIKYNDKHPILTDFNWGFDDNEIYKIQKKMSEHVDNIQLYDLNLHAIMIDFYMVRRFLDKNYITNSISYTGIAHTSNTVYLLLKMFNFKITHISKTNTNNIDELNQIIVQQENPFLTQHYIYPSLDVQCSDITHFPTEFN